MLSFQSLELEVASFMRSLRRILPEGFFGMEDTKATFRILLYGATCFDTNSIIDFSDKKLPVFLTTYAIGNCPTCLSGYL